MTEQVEFVEMEIKVNVPKKTHDLLVDLSKLVDVSIEDILREELEDMLEGFVQCGYYDAWIEVALRKRGVDC